MSIFREKTMKFITLIVGLFFVTAAHAGTPPAGTVNIPDLVDRVDKGVVNIRAVQIIRESLGLPPGFEDFYMFYGVPSERLRKQPALGSGFVINDDGYILTNDHVVANASEVEVQFNDDGKSVIPAKILGTDKKTDVALLKVKPGKYLKPLHLGDSDATRVGETVVAIGNPFGLSHTVTAGIISAKNRTIGQGPFDNFIQTDASINFGNSGGPLFNAHGDVIGINAAISARGQGLGFAIPINQAKRLVPELAKYGRIKRGWLGALLITTPYGLVVDGVVLRSPADKAGLKSGDFIVSVDGQKTKELFDAEKALGEKKPGDKTTIQIRRENQLTRRLLTIDIPLTDEPKRTDLPPGLI